MADFYPVLSRAVAGLQNQSPEARRAIYDRANQVLVAQLRAMDPPVSEIEITRQRLALDEVIARIEREQAPLADEIPDDWTAQAVSEPAAAATEPEARVVQPRPQLARESLPALPDQDGASIDRPRVDIAVAPTRRSLPWRKLVVAGGVGVAVMGIAAMAYYVNRGNRASPPVATAPAVSQPQPAGSPKIADRVGAEPAAPAPTNPPIAGPGSAANPPRAEIAVAQRAVLYVEPADASQPPRQITGRATWRIEAQNAGQGQPLETVIRADVEVPEAGLSLVFTIRRNSDAAFPASHIIGMRFMRGQDDGNGAVREAGVPQFKSEENERGAPLSALTSPLGENLFVTALSRVPVELERNLELLRTRNWIDIPVRFASGRRGIIAFEKGLSGDQRIAEGLTVWRQ
jgi:hypothetical protein